MDQFQINMYDSKIMSTHKHNHTHVHAQFQWKQKNQGHYLYISSRINYVGRLHTEPMLPIYAERAPDSDSHSQKKFGNEGKRAILHAKAKP